MRIVHLEAGRELFGGARQVAYLIEGLAELGVDNVLLCARGSAIGRLRLPAEIVELPLAGDLDFGQIKRLARELRTFEPDLLHVHSRRGADLYGGLAARRAGVPAVLTRRVASLEPRLWARLKFRAYRRIIAISTAVEAELVGRFGVDPAIVTRIPSAVDTQRFRPRDARAALNATLGLPTDAVAVACVAQLIPRKGHDALLRAFAALAPRNPALYLVCFGRGPLETALARRIDSLGLGSRVRLAGFRGDLAELLPGCALLVHPAEREGLGVAVLEGLAAGVPVVAARAGGIPDAIDDGVTGLLIPPGDDAALARAIERVLADRSLSERLSAAGRARVEDAFSIARMSRATLGVYGEVIGGDGPER
jgi:glycosyltransferase involved in cell wall biosynthesis